MSRDILTSALEHVQICRERDFNPSFALIEEALQTAVDERTARDNQLGSKVYDRVKMKEAVVECCEVERMARAFLSGTRQITNEEAVMIASFFVALHAVQHEKGAVRA